MFLFQLGNSNYNGWTNLRQIYHSSVYIVLSVIQLRIAKWIYKIANFHLSVFSCGHTTLELAVSVGQSVGRSVGWSVT